MPRAVQLLHVTKIKSFIVDINQSFFLISYLKISNGRLTKEINFKNFYLESGCFFRYFLIGWVITGNWKLGGSIASIEVMTKIFLYYFHERIWNKIEWGKNKKWFINSFYERK